DDEPCPPDLLRRTWHEDMLWYGPSGIGATYTIPRYQKQHQFPFRMNVTEKVYNGHVARIAEGNYCGFFGWANLTNRNRGGFLGLPEAREPSDMRIVDIYRRQDNKLAENWVFIDIPHYLNQQGLDVLARLRELGST
ncbi:MAG: nuclear transport factor 2 family protein, partial [Pseudomonadota bacterium]